MAIVSPPDRSMQAAIYLSFLIFMLVLIGTLTLLVSRRRSKIAMWVSTAMFALGLPGFVQTIASGQAFGLEIIAVLQGIGQAAGLRPTLHSIRATLDATRGRRAAEAA